jgi:anti-sigma factor RsiW
MSCETTRGQIEAFLSGRLAGEESRAVRLHLAACSACAATLAAADRVELLPAVDPEIEPSPDLGARFRTRLEAHRELKEARRSWWSVLAWPVPRQLAAAGALAAFLVFGLYVGMHRENIPPTGPGASEITIAENLPLLQDMKVIENLDLLEDFDAIENLSVQ